MHCRAGEQGHHHTVGAPTSGMNVLVGDGSQQPFPPVLGLQVPVENSSFVLGVGGFCFVFLFLHIPPSILKHVLLNIMQWTYTKIHLVSATRFF